MDDLPLNEDDSGKGGAARHEAGHLTAALEILGEGACSINWSSTGGLVEWFGSMHWKPSTRLGTNDEMQRIAIAGPAAQYMGDHPTARIRECAAEVFCNPKYRSDEDFAHFPKENVEVKLPPLVDEVLALVQNRRRFFDWAVDELMKHGEISSDAAADAFVSLNR